MGCELELHKCNPFLKLRLVYHVHLQLSEGIVKTLPCTTNVNKWVQNMIDYLRSTMSYTDINNVYHLDKVELILISDKTYNSVNK